MTPYYERVGITIFNARCEDVLASLATGSVDLVLTDPPFNARFDYGADVDDNRPWSEYTAWLDGIVAECERVSAGMVMVFLSVTGLIRFAPVRAPRWVCSWTKSVGGTHSAGNSGFFPRWEPCLIYGKTWGAGGRVPPGVMPDAWYHLPTRATGHPCPKPISLTHEIISRHPARIILDPFMGSGTVLRAAMDCGRNAIGCEVNEAYCEIAARRLEQSVLDLGGAA
jgi:site-specific DNA-methyltransferase (adenine-specific)